MDPTPDTDGRSLETSSIVGETAVNKIIKRCNSGNQGDVVVLDIDGTVYNHYQDSTESWVKEGDNSTLSEKVTAGSIPLVLISGRPDWGSAEDIEMDSYHLCRADVIAAGAGSIIYFRGEDGILHLDTEYIEHLKTTPVTVRLTRQQYDRMSTSLQNDFSHIETKREDVTNDSLLFSREMTYDPDKMQPILTAITSGIEGVAEVKVDNNAGLNFAVLDLDKIPLDTLRSLLFTLRNSLKGVTIEFSEDLKDISSEYFSGWMQIVPKDGGKDGALRYITKKIREKVGQTTTEPEITAHIFGDATIDIWMLATGNTGGQDSGVHFKQYVLGNVTPYAKGKLSRVIENVTDVKVDNNEPRAHLTQITESGPQGIISVVNNL